MRRSCTTEDAFVRFHFELENGEIDKCRNQFAEKFLAGQEAKSDERSYGQVIL